MNKIYQPSNMGILINTLLAALVISALSFLSYYLVSHPHIISDFAWGAFVILMLINLYIVYVSVQFAVERLTISKNELIYKGLFKERVIPINEIKGYKQVAFNFRVYTKKTRDESILISIYYKGIEEIRQWLEENFEEVATLTEEEQALETYQVEQEEIASDQDFGGHAEAVKDNYRRTNRYVNLFNVFSWAIAIWYMFSPTYYRLLTVLVLVIPIIALVLVRAKKGLVRLFTEKGSVYINIGITVGLMPLVLMLRAVLDIDLVSYQPLWIPTIITTLLGLVLVYNAAWKELKPKKVGEALIAFVFVAGATMMYFGAAIIQVNATFDDRPYQVYERQVIAKKTTGSGDDEEYYLIIKNTLLGGSTNELKVYEEIYEMIQPKDRVNIYLKPGVFKIPWIRYVEKRK